MGQQVNLLSGVKLTPLKIVSVNDGDILHMLKKNDPEFKDFGEAYFSFINKDKIKGWKRHREMTQNIVVPIGEIKFVLYDDRDISSTKNQFFSVSLSLKNYKRLTIPPMIWVGFQGIHNQQNMLLNIASIPHDPKETDKRDINSIPYSWYKE